MSYLVREANYRLYFKVQNQRNPTAAEVAMALQIEIARQETIEKAIKAIENSRPFGIEHKYDKSDWLEDNERCKQKLIQLQRWSQGERQRQC